MRIKKTSIDWCPYIPEHWEVKRIKDIAFLQSGKSITALDLHDDALYPVYGGNGFRGFTDTYTNEGDYVLIGRQGALCGNINYAHGKFFATEHAVVVYTKKGEITRWLGETLNIANLNRLSMTAAQPGLAVSAINNQPIPYPPQNERKRIAEYLNDKAGKIDARVSLLSKKRDAYQRLKKALISRVVTKGLNPNAKIKPSGVDWIGEIPEGWKVKRIKEIGSLKLGKMLSEKPIPGYKLCKYLKSKNIGHLYLNMDSVEEMYFSEEEMNQLMLHKEDLLLSEGGEVGKTAIWNGELEECGIQNSVHKLTTFKGFSPKYYLYYSYMLSDNGYYKSIVNLVSIMHLTYEKLRRVVVLAPPLSEQQSIATYLDEKCSEIDANIANLEKQIEKYKELKRALISEVVTGKRRV